MTAAHEAAAGHGLRRNPSALVFLPAHIYPAEVTIPGRDTSECIPYRRRAPAVPNDLGNTFRTGEAGFRYGFASGLLMKSANVEEERKRTPQLTARRITSCGGMRMECKPRPEGEPGESAGWLLEADGGEEVAGGGGGAEVGAEAEDVNAAAGSGFELPAEFVAGHRDVAGRHFRTRIL